MIGRKVGIDCVIILLIFFASVISSSEANNNGFATAKYSLIVGVSGLSGDYLTNSTLFPNIHNLIANGSYTFQARNVLPTTSKPNWASVLSSGGPEETGVNSDFWYLKSNCVNYRVVDDQCVSCDSCSFIVNAVFDLMKDDSKIYNMTLNLFENVLHDLCNELKFPAKQTCNTFVSLFAADIFNAFLNSNLQNEFCFTVGACDNLLSPLNGDLFPTLFKMARENSELMKTAFFTDSKLLVNILEGNVIDYFSFQENSAQLVSDFIAVTEDHQPQISFIHFNDVNLAGTSYGFGSPQYFSALQKIDNYIGQLLETYSRLGMMGESVFMITSDHGGQKLSYDYTNSNTVEIPWIAFGVGIAKSFQIPSYVRTIDCAPTILWAMGIPASEQWIGRAVTEIWNTSSIPTSQLPPIRLTQNVVVVIVSGLTSTATQYTVTPTINELVNNGASSFTSRAVMPTTSLTNIASILMSAGTEEHGVCEGDLDTACYWLPPPHVPDLPPITGNNTLFPTIFDVVKNGEYNQKNFDYTTACFYNWPNVSSFFTSSLDYQFQSSFDEYVAGNASAYLSNSSLAGVTVIQFNEVEEAALQNGFNSSQYLTAVSTVDQYINDILQTLAVYSPDSLLLITSDHGGIKKTIGATNDQSIIVPWIAAGKMVRAGYQISNYVRVFDTASVAALALQVAQPTAWIGRVPPIFK